MAQIDINGPIIGPSHAKRMEALLRHFRACGLPLSTCADRKHLGRTVATLKGYCRRIGLAFPDYTPRAMRADMQDKPFVVIPRCSVCGRAKNQHKASTLECPQGKRTPVGYASYSTERFAEAA